jgi:phosphatidylglycerophosphate synthase
MNKGENNVGTNLKAGTNLNGRKIPPEFENPFDNVLISAAQSTNPFLRHIGFTPNMLTICALITGVIAAYAVWRSWFFIAAVCTLISYFFDTLDGNMARMFNMTSSFGDILDHGCDLVKYILLFLAFWYNRYLPHRFKVISMSILGVLYICMNIHMGCQEKSYAKQQIDTLTPFEYLCPNSSYIRYTRWFGIGTWILTLLVILVTSHFMIRTL